MLKVINKLASFAIMMVLAAIYFSGCDDRVSAPQQNKPSFQGDINVVRDYNARRVIGEFSFYRNGDPVEHGVVQFNDSALTTNVGGIYSLQTSLDDIFDGQNIIRFTSPRDNYDISIAISMPDSFGVININPRDNRGVADVTIQWSRPANATKVLLVVVARNYPINGSLPYMAVLDDEITTQIVPYTAFQDATGFDIRDIYYVYLAAFNQGFHEYEGIEFPVPMNLPVRRLNNPSGFATYGTVAPVDSILVLQ